MAGLPAPAAVVAEDLAACCGCKAWAAAVAARGPFAGGSALLAAARAVWWGEVGVAGWLEALAAHPRIGDVESLRERYGQAFGAHSEGEQQGVAGASDEVLHALKAMNELMHTKKGRKAPHRERALRGYQRALGDVMGTLGLTTSDPDAVVCEMKRLALRRCGKTEEDLASIIALRQRARKEKDFATSDQLRDDLMRVGITLLDSPQGTEWRPVSIV